MRSVGFSRTKSFLFSVGASESLVLKGSDCTLFQTTHALELLHYPFCCIEFVFKTHLLIGILPLRYLCSSAEYSSATSVIDCCLCGSVGASQFFAVWFSQLSITAPSVLSWSTPKSTLILLVVVQPQQTNMLLGALESSH